MINGNQAGHFTLRLWLFLLHPSLKEKDNHKEMEKMLFAVGFFTYFFLALAFLILSRPYLLLLYSQKIVSLGRYINNHPLNYSVFKLMSSQDAELDVFI